MTLLRKNFAAVALAASLSAAAATSAAAGPMFGTPGLHAASRGDVVDVRWRGNYAGAVAAGVIGGMALGAMAAASQPYYGPPPAYYGRPYYAPPPAYYAPPPAYEYGYGYGYAPVYPVPYNRGRRDHNSGGNW